MSKWLTVLAILIAPYFILRSPNVPQVLIRVIAVSIWAFGGPVGFFWFALKSQMIRPGGKLYQPQFDDVRPKIERNIRFVVIAFGVFYFFVLTLPFAQDLIQVAINQRLSRVTEKVKYVRRGTRGPSESIGFSGSEKNYYLFYRSKLLTIDDTYEFVVLPRSRMILDYTDFRQ